MSVIPIDRDRQTVDEALGTVRRALDAYEAGRTTVGVTVWVLSMAASQAEGACRRRRPWLDHPAPAA